MLQKDWLAHAVPVEILAGILRAVHTTSGSNANISNCLTVCKQWHAIAHPILYHRVVLTMDNIQPFVATVKKENAARIRSLTLRPNYPVFVGTYTTNIFVKCLPALLEIIREMTWLSSLSLFLSLGPGGWFLPKNTTVNLLKVLPESCVDLEIVSDRESSRHQPPPHICDTLRAMMPRMRNVRLNLRTICPGVLGTFERTPNEKEARFVPSKLPYLKTLQIDCTRGGNINLLCWECSDDAASSRDSPFSTMANALQTLAGSPSHCPPTAKLRILGAKKTPRPAPENGYVDGVDWSAHRCIVLADMRSGTSTAFPFIPIPKGPDSRETWLSYSKNIPWLLRTGEGRGIVGRDNEVLSYAEGMPWKTLQGGARLPSSKVDVTLDQVEPLAVTEEAQWKAEHPEKDCFLWWNERLAGEALVDAEHRESPATYLDLEPIPQKTPAGWHRLRYDRRGVLHKLGPSGYLRPDREPPLEEQEGAGKWEQTYSVADTSVWYYHHELERE
ncbi:hypothetical protein F4780DRAFT_765803 [Xylariomycetidae sp. FL0641]|nr:hypothetical protein F4780DRAFT_765803 [Xylariomycetidae sp. FL0641]